MYALANDENGMPVSVPAGAFGWLVRKHAGGKGRPAAVYDGEGRPLVVALDATAVDLAAMGVGAGSYRLDAVDDRRRQLGVVAYTELRGTVEEEVAPNAGDAAVMALARAVEAMQRVQAERERVQAQMFMRLIDRLAPVPLRTGDDLKGALGQMVEVQKAMKKLAPVEATVRNAGAGDVDEQWWNSPVLASAVDSVVKQGGPLITRWLWGKMGLTSEQLAPFEGASGAAPTAQLPAETPAPKELPPEVAARRDKLAAVLAELDEAEGAKVEVALRTLPANVIITAEEKLLALPTKEAAAFLRKTLAEPAAPIAVAAGESAKP